MASKKRARFDRASTDILIRNATLVDPAGVAEDRSVSMIVRGGAFEIICEDAAAGEESDQVVDAGAGIIRALWA